MEPANLTPAPEEDDSALAAMLDRTAPPTLPDDGFSARVLAALPAAPAAQRRSPTQRYLLCVLGAGCGLVTAITQALGSATPALSLPASEAVLVPAVVLTALTVALASLGYVFLRGLRLSPGLARP